MLLLHALSAKFSLNIYQVYFYEYALSETSTHEVDLGVILIGELFFHN